MPHELEAKFRVADHEPIRARLRAAGADGRGSVLESNYILDRADGLLRRQGCGLRVRVAEPITEQPTPSSQPPRSTAEAHDDWNPPMDRTREISGKVVTLTFKGPRAPGPFKSREEIETRVADADTLLDLLDRLGFQPVLVYEKRREHWRLDDCRIELDTPPHIGLFVEIEGPTESAIRTVQRRLELSDADLVRESYVRLLSDYCAQRNRAPLNLTLDHPLP